MTKLSKPVSRETANVTRGRAVIVTLAPCGSQSEARIGFRCKGERLQYVARVSDLYQMAALWHGQREAQAKRAARKMGVPWKTARKVFLAANTI